MTQIYSFNEESIDVRGAKVRLLSGGKGEPLLWLHGANGGGWNPFLEELSSSFEVLAPDHPGFGSSELPNGFSTIEDMAFYYRDFLDVLDFERVYICAQSIGGWIGLQFALTQTQRVNKLIVCDPAGVHIPGKDGPDPFILTMPQLSQLLYYDKAKLPNMPKREEVTIETLRNRSMYARLAWEKGYDPKLLYRLQGLRVPTLIVWGRNDQLIPLEFGEKLQSSIPHSRLSIIEDCGHLPYAEKPAELIEKTRNFIRCN